MFIRDVCKTVNRWLSGTIDPAATTDNQSVYQRYHDHVLNHCKKRASIHPLLVEVQYEYSTHGQILEDHLLVTYMSIDHIPSIVEYTALPPNGRIAPRFFFWDGIDVTPFISHEEWTIGPGSIIQFKY